MNYEYYHITSENLKTMKVSKGNVLIRVVNRDNQKGDIVLAYKDNKPFLPDHGVVTLISKVDNPDNIQVGDVVLFEKYQGYRFRDEFNNDYILMEIKKITGVFE